MATGVASPRAQGQEMTSTEMARARALREPDRERDERDGQHGGDEHAGDLVRGLCDGGLGGGGVGDHFDDLGKGGILSDSGCFTFDKSGLVHSCRRNHISGFFVNRNTFTGQRGFVNCSSSFQDYSVYRNILSRADDKGFSFLNLLNRNGKFLSLSYHDRSFGCQLHKAFKCIRCLSFRTGFQHFSDCDQCQDQTVFIPHEIFSGILISGKQVFVVVQMHLGEIKIQGHTFHNHFTAFLEGSEETCKKRECDQHTEDSEKARG